MAKSRVNEAEFRKLIKNMNRLTNSKKIVGIVTAGLKRGAKTIQESAQGLLDPNNEAHTPIMASHLPFALRAGIVVSKASKRTVAMEGYSQTSAMFRVGYAKGAKGIIYDLMLLDGGSKFHAPNPVLLKAAQTNGDRVLNTMRDYIIKRIFSLIKKG